MTVADSTTPPAGRVLAEFAAGLTADDVPAAVRHRAAVLVLDAVGVALGNVGNDAVRGVRATIGAHAGAADARVWGTAARASAPGAAMANGIAVHGNDFDDTHGEAGLHASATVVPAALAVADLRGANGKDTIAAIVAGYEVACRLGAAAPHQFTRHRWHATPVCGAVASAAAAARLLGSDAATTAHALGIAASMASGTLQPLEEGRPVKAFHAGWGAHNGVWAALLAESGLSAPDYALDGRQGFFNAFVGADWDASRLVRGLMTEWETLAIIPKPYPCCHFLHALTDAALEFRQAHSADEVLAFTAQVPREAEFVVCEPWEQKLSPASGYAAKFSLPYVVAAALAQGRLTQGEFEPDTMTRVQSGPLMRTAAYAFDADPGLAKSYGGELVIETPTGTWSRRVEHPTGSANRPLTDEQLEAKFRGAVDPLLGADGSAALAAQILALADLDDVHRLGLGPAPSGEEET